MTTQKKRSLKDYVNALVDDQGLRTDVTVTMTDTTLWKIIGGLLAAGVGIALIVNLIKNAFPNKQLAEIKTLLMEIKKG